MKRLQRYSKPHKVFIPSNMGNVCLNEDVTVMEDELSQLQALTKEFAEGIVKNCINFDVGDDHMDQQCIYCEEFDINHTPTHKSKCVVLKAQQYLDSLKESV